MTVGFKFDTGLFCGTGDTIGVFGSGKYLRISELV